MTPEDFASRYPRLFHLTRPEAIPLIERVGLMSPEALCELFGVSDKSKEIILNNRRPKSVTLFSDTFGEVTIHDNAPLSEKALSKCLDDGLSPSDWIRMLNQRVFFFTDQKRAETLSRGPAHKGQARRLFVIDTLSLLRKHIKHSAISPINTGSTIHVPARRGFATFADLSELNFEKWRYSRPKKTPDKPNELSILNGVPDFLDHVMCVQTI